MGKIATELAAEAHQVAALTWALYWENPNLHVVGLPLSLLCPEELTPVTQCKSQTLQGTMRIDSCKIVDIPLLGL